MAWAGALYYPFMRVRDTAWLKAAVLYWDSLYRFQPHGYDLRETEDTKALVEADFLRSLNPGLTPTRLPPIYWCLRAHTPTCYSADSVSMI